MAEGVARLAAGESYASVGNWALRKVRALGRDVDERKHKVSWHVGADWTEAAGPVLFGHVDSRLREVALQERERLDMLTDQGLALDHPQVVVVDGHPVYGVRASSASRQRFGFYVLVLAEVDWTGETRQTRLRLARVLPVASTAAWALVFDELGYQPNVVVADGAHAIRNGLTAAYGNGPVLVPSLPHITGAITSSLVRYRPSLRDTASRRERLVEPFDTHLSQVRKGSLVVTDASAWQDWWDQLEQIAQNFGIPKSKITGHRTEHERRIDARVRDIFTDYPDVPASTGGVEMIIRRSIKPMLALRRQSFANIERTNTLFDLVVCREHNLFDDLHHVEHLLTEDAVSHNGHTTRLRAIEDKHTLNGRYRSLHDSYLIEQLAKERGLL